MYALFFIHNLFIIGLSGTDKKNSEYKLFITVLSRKYLKIRIIDGIIRPPKVGNLLFICLEYLTLLMCFGIADYKLMSVVKKSSQYNTAHTVAETPYFWLSYNAQHFHLCPGTLLHTVCLSDPCHCIL